MKLNAKRQPSSQIPEINLVPMMDVLMTVLTFFIIISITLGSEQIFTVDAPESEDASLLEDTANSVEPFVVGLNSERELLLQDEVVSEQELTAAVTAYLSDNPDGMLHLKADRGLEFEAASEVLVLLQAIAIGREIALIVE